MASNFPTSLDSFSAKADGTDYPSAAHINDLQNGLVTAQTKVGINSSADTNSLDYKVANMWKTIYPVDAVYFSYVSTSPATLFGGTWSALSAGKFIVTYNATDTDFDAAGDTGGEKTHALTTAELATHTHIQDAHTHGFSTGGATTGGLSRLSGGGTDVNSGSTTPTNQNTGSGTAHNNLPPFITLYSWRRTA